MTPPATSPPLSWRGYALIAAGVMAFTLYGSLVPFGFRAVPLEEAFDGFARAMTAPPQRLSRSDGLANVLLGVPLGFALLGAARVDRRGAGWTTLAAVALLPACAAFAAGVEFLQLFEPSRTCSVTDVVAQTLGSAVGMLAWAVAGQRLTEGVRRAASGEDGGVRLLVAYLALLAFIQVLPLDLNSSPADLYRKIRDGQVRLTPFAEFRGGDAAGRWSRVETLIQLFGVYLPAGLLAGGVRRVGVVTVVAAAAALSVGLECAQLLVRSRTTNATDAVVGWAAVMAGWAVVRSAPGAVVGSGAGLAWFAALAVAWWHPFDWHWDLGFDRLSGLNPAPFVGLEDRPALFALESVLTKLTLFAPLGALAGRRWVVGAAVGAVAAAALEGGQLFLVTRYPSVTDVLIGAAGAGVGAWVAGLFPGVGGRAGGVNPPHL
ncbi:MAG: VanZ family protein [Gemmataceae bacterium]